VRGKIFKAIMASLLIVAILTVQVSQVLVIHGMEDSYNNVSMISPLLETPEDKEKTDESKPETINHALA